MNIYTNQDLIDTSKKAIRICHYLSPISFEIINLKDINTLDMSYNYVDLSIHLNNKSITSLNISSCGITDEYIKNCNLPNLKILNISANSISSEGCKYLSKIPTLTNLNISSNPRMGKEGLDSICDNTSITHLDISQNLLSSKDINKLCQNKYISTLDVSYNLLTENDMIRLSKMPYLSHMWIYNNSVSLANLENILENKIKETITKGTILNSFIHIDIINYIFKQYYYLKLDLNNTILN